MANELIVNIAPGRTRVALVEETHVAEVHHESTGEGSPNGHICKGRVARVLPGMQAAFVDIGLQRSAFLYVDDVGSRAEELPSEGTDEGEDSPTEPPPRLRAVGPGESPSVAVPIEQQLKTGDVVIVQVSKGPVGTKGARVTTRLSLPGRLVVLMPHADHVGVSRRIGDEEERSRLRDLVLDLRPPGVGLIVRTAAEGADRESLKTDIEVLVTIWNELVKKKDRAPCPSLLFSDLDLSLRCIRDLLTHDLDRVVCDDDREFERIETFARQVMPTLAHRVELYDGAEPIFEAFGIEHDLQRALAPRVWLRSGGYLIIDEHEALTSIDVNTGRYVGKRNLDETMLKTNLEAVPEIAYQLRLRGVGGIIVVDFIDMERVEHREKVVRALEAALRRDRARTVIHPMTELGLVELTRKRTAPSLLKRLTEPCPKCEGKGRIKNIQTTVFEVIREVLRVGRLVGTDSLGIHVHPDVADALCGGARSLLEESEALTGKHTVTFPVVSFDREDFDVIGVDTGISPTKILRPALASD